METAGKMRGCLSKAPTRLVAFDHAEFPLGCGRSSFAPVLVAPPFDAMPTGCQQVIYTKIHKAV